MQKAAQLPKGNNVVVEELSKSEALQSHTSATTHASAIPRGRAQRWLVIVLLVGICSVHTVVARSSSSRSSGSSGSSASSAAGDVAAGMAGTVVIEDVVCKARDAFIPVQHAQDCIYAFLFGVGVVLAQSIALECCQASEKHANDVSSWLCIFAVVDSFLVLMFGLEAAFRDPPPSSFSLAYFLFGGNDDLDLVAGAASGMILMIKVNLNGGGWDMLKEELGKVLPGLLYTYMWTGIGWAVGGALVATFSSCDTGSCASIHATSGGRSADWWGGECWWGCECGGGVTLPETAFEVSNSTCAAHADCPVGSYCPGPVLGEGPGEGEDNGSSDSSRHSKRFTRNCRACSSLDVCAFGPGERTQCYTVDNQCCGEALLRNCPSNPYRCIGISRDNTRNSDTAEPFPAWMAGWGGSCPPGSSCDDNSCESIVECHANTFCAGACEECEACADGSTCDAGGCAECERATVRDRCSGNSDSTTDVICRDGTVLVPRSYKIASLTSEAAETRSATCCESFQDAAARRAEMSSEADAAIAVGGGLLVGLLCCCCCLCVRKKERTVGVSG
jgi:hypothetical protein